METYNSTKTIHLHTFEVAEFEWEQVKPAFHVIFEGFEFLQNGTTQNLVNDWEALHYRGLIFERRLYTGQWVTYPCILDCRSSGPHGRIDTLESDC